MLVLSKFSEQVSKLFGVILMIAADNNHHVINADKKICS